MLWWILISQQLTLKDERGGEVDEYSSGRTDGVWCRTAQVAGPPRLLLCIESVWLGSYLLLCPPYGGADGVARKWFLDVTPPPLRVYKNNNTRKKRDETIEGKASGARATNHQMTNSRRKKNASSKQWLYIGPPAYTPRRRVYNSYNSQHNNGGTRGQATQRQRSNKGADGCFSFPPPAGIVLYFFFFEVARRQRKKTSRGKIDVIGRRRNRRRVYIWFHSFFFPLSPHRVCVKAKPIIPSPLMPYIYIYIWGEHKRKECHRSETAGHILEAAIIYGKSISKGSQWYIYIYIYEIDPKLLDPLFSLYLY